MVKVQDCYKEVLKKIKVVMKIKNVNKKMDIQIILEKEKN